MPCIYKQAMSLFNIKPTNFKKETFYAIIVFVYI